MLVKKFYPGLAVLLALTLAALACGSGRGAEPSATPFVKATLDLPTQAEATEEATPKPKPTQEPRPTRTPRAETSPSPVAAPFTLSSEAFAHASGAFAVNLPEGWEVTERDNSVFVAEPDGVSSIEVSFVNAGVELDAEGLDTFIQANESNWFGTFENYAQTSIEPQSDGSIGVFKTLDDGGVEYTVSSYYWLEGTVVYEEDFWVETEHYEAYVDGLLEVANSIQTDADAGAQVDPYVVAYTFADPTRNLFEFSVPYAWTYTTDSSDTAVLDTFTSPDELTYIENISYDDGTAISRSEAGQFALTLLKEFYEIDDIRVTDDQVQSDGSERLSWNSPGRGIRGESFFETRSTTFLLLTWVVSEDDYDTYAPVWSNLLDSYAAPEQ